MKITKSKKFILLETVFYLHTGIIGAVYTLYLISLGLSIFQANLISTIFNVASIIFEVPSGAMCDSIGKRKTAILAGIALGIAMICFLLGNSVFIIIIAQLLWGISYALESGTIEAWLVNEEKLKGSDLDNVFASSKKIQSITMILGSFIGTWMADCSLRLIWSVPLISAIIFTVLVFIFIDEDKIKLSDKSIYKLYSETLTYAKEGGKLILKSEQLSYIYILVTLMGFISSPLMTFWSIYLNQLEPSFSYMYLSTVWLLIQVALIIGNQIIKYIGKHVSRRQIFSVTFFIFGIAIILMNLWSYMVIAIILICIQEMVWTIICTVQRGLLNDYLDDKNRVTMLSFSSLFNACGKILASALFGLLADKFSIMFSWTFSGVLSLLAAVYVNYMYKKLNSKFL